MGAFLSLVLIVIGVALVWRALSARAQASLSKAWPSAEGLVLTSGVEASEFQRGDELGTVRKFTPVVSYAFKVGQRQRVGNGIAIGLKNLYSELGDAEQHAQRYPVGSKVKVFHDPRGSASVLEPGDTRSANTILSIGLGIVLTGVLLLGVFR